MGPTAAGKTPLAVHLVRHFPCEIISVDSAMIYRGMNIGTAKPTADVLAIAPHRLIDKLDPAQRYSAGQFCADALAEIADIHAHGRIPLLVGGTMLYFRTLQQGLAKLPKADLNLRAELQKQAQQFGWPTLHAQLAQVDPAAAARIQATDGQRIQRALEVYQLTGKAISTWHTEDTHPLHNYTVHNLALAPTDRAHLHTRIAQRFAQMLAQGFVDEVRHLYTRGDLNPDLPALRSVGYRQVWAYLAGEISYDYMHEQAIAATRQLAKRQMTWLRSWPEITWFASDAPDLYTQVGSWMQANLRSMLLP
jgi:tRNA dimethylallyltransferase